MPMAYSAHTDTTESDPLSPPHPPLFLSTSLSYTNAIPEPDNTSNPSAQSAIAQHLIATYFRRFIAWCVLFILAILAYVAVMIWAAIQFDFSDSNDACNGDYRTWMTGFFVVILYTMTLGRVIKYRLGHRQDEPSPPAVKKYNLLLCAFFLVYFAIGLKWSQSDNSMECKEADGDAYQSWLWLMILGLSCQVLVFGGLGLFAWALMWLVRNGLLNDETKAAPKDTAKNLADVPVADLPTDDACSVCLDSFTGGGGVKRTPCGHLFHEKCLENWFKVATSCPVCRVDVVEGAGTGAESIV